MTPEMTIREILSGSSLNRKTKMAMKIAMMAMAPEWIDTPFRYKVIGDDPIDRALLIMLPSREIRIEIRRLIDLVFDLIEIMRVHEEDPKSFIADQGFSFTGRGIAELSDKAGVDPA